MSLSHFFRKIVENKTESKKKLFHHKVLMKHNEKKYCETRAREKEIKKCKKIILFAARKSVDLESNIHMERGFISGHKKCECMYKITIHRQKEVFFCNIFMRILLNYILTFIKWKLYYGTFKAHYDVDEKKSERNGISNYNLENLKNPFNLLRDDFSRTLDILFFFQSILTLTTTKIKKNSSYVQHRAIFSFFYLSSPKRRRRYMKRAMKKFFNLFAQWRHKRRHINNEQKRGKITVNRVSFTRKKKLWNAHTIFIFKVCIKYNCMEEKLCTAVES